MSVSINFFADFPQEKVNKVILEQRQNKTGNRIKGNISQHPMPFEMNNSRFDRYQISLERGDSASPNNREILYIGPELDTTFITTDYVQDDDIVIYGQGVLVVDNAMLTLSGTLLIQDEGKAIFRNNAYLHFEQYYVGQYYVWMLDDSQFEATDATIDANGVMHYAQLYDNCTYFASNTNFPDWTFRKVFNNSTLILEDVDHVGDMIVDDSCFVHFTRCDTLMPWFEMPDGSVVNTQFPDPEFVEHFEFSDDTPGVDGIYYTFVADSCSQCWWSLETFNGCDVTINNSIIRGSCVRMFGSNTINIGEIENNTMYSNFIVPLSDRNLEYNDTYVYWWNWYPYDDIIFNIDSCSFGEMIGRGNSETYATNCIHNGATIMLGVGFDAFVSFVDGISYSYVGTFQNGTYLFVNSTITPLWSYQSANIAHDNSYLLAVNSYFEYEPEAMDSALVMFTLIDSLQNYFVGETIEISGSAWIESGDLSITFDKYNLYYANEGSNDWTLVEESLTQVDHDILADWNTSELSEGNYELKLTIFDSEGDSLIAFRTITLLPDTGTDEEISACKTELSGNFPNPFNPTTTINLSLGIDSIISLEIFNLKGQEVKALANDEFDQGLHKITWDGKDNSGKEVSSGVYLYKLDVGGKSISVKKCLLLR